MESIFKPSQKKIKELGINGSVFVIKKIKYLTHQVRKLMTNIDSQEF